jgi:hypothetical protein
MCRAPDWQGILLMECGRHSESDQSAGVNQVFELGFAADRPAHGLSYLQGSALAYSGTVTTAVDEPIFPL